GMACHDIYPKGQARPRESGVRCGDVGSRGVVDVARGRGRFKVAVAVAGACAAMGLAYAGFALANTIGVTLTGKGPQPGTVSVAVGDTLAFTNAENVAHIVSSKPLGFTTPLIQGGGTYTYIVTKPGSWGYQVADSQGKNRLQGS